MFQKRIPDAVKSDGSTVPYEPGKGYKLGVGTYYIDASMPDAVNATIHCTWDATLVATALTVDTSNMPAFKTNGQPYTDSGSPVDVPLTQAAGTGLWFTQNPSTAYVPIFGGTVTNMTVAIAGGTAGGCEFDVGNLAARRMRTGIVVTTGGYLRQHAHGKMA